jgi:hypothetical protein
VLATQNLSDVVNSPIRQTILESCFTRILLPNPSAMNDDLKELYMGHLGLNHAQVRLIAASIMKSCQNIFINMRYSCIHMRRNILLYGRLYRNSLACRFYDWQGFFTLLNPDGTALANEIS